MSLCPRCGRERDAKDVCSACRLSGRDSAVTAAAVELEEARKTFKVAHENSEQELERFMDLPIGSPDGLRLLRRENRRLEYAADHLNRAIAKYLKALQDRRIS